MSRRRKKPHTLRNALVAVVVLMVITSIVIAAYQMNARTGPPTYSDVSSSSVNASSSCTFSVLWADDVNVSGYVFESNNTGVFVNDTWTPFTDSANQNPANTSVTRTLNSTIGNVVSWRFWCNDTSNRWRMTSLQTLFVESDKVLFEIRMENTTRSITIELYDDMPITTGNFRNLVRTGAYDGTVFHRIVPGRVIQGGDLSSKGITVPPIPNEPNKHSNLWGTLAMAKISGQPDSATSQFFINLNDTNAAFWDSNYPVFGRVIAGMDVVDAISQVPIYPANDGKPVQDVTLITAQFID